ncbi:hypothetical protein Bca101_060561 [Brassica carinata]
MRFDLLTFFIVVVSEGRFKLGLKFVKQSKSQNDTASVLDTKGKMKMGQSEIKPSHKETSPSSEASTAQRLLSKGEDKNKRGEVRMTKASREVNVLKLYNQFSALDSLKDQD